MTRARRYSPEPYVETDAEKAEWEAMNQPKPRVRSQAEQEALTARVRELQVVNRPLTTAELLPGLWVRMLYVDGGGKPAGSRIGLLAEDYRDPDRLVLWADHGAGFTPGSHYILGPSGYGRDREMPTHEMRPIPASWLSKQTRERIKAYAERGRWNRSTRRWELDG